MTLQQEDQPSTSSLVTSQNRREKVVNRGLYVCAGGGMTYKFDKISTNL